MPGGVAQDADADPPYCGSALSQSLARFSLRLWRWQIEGGVPPQAKLVLVGAPHTSYLDFALTKLAARALGVRVFWVGKKELFPGLLEPFVRQLGGIPVDRSSSQNFVETMVSEFRGRDRFYLAVMPTGSRSNPDRWRSGFYYIAIGADVPILPVVFDWGLRTLRLGPVLWLDPDAGYEAELARVRSTFDGARGRRRTLTSVLALLGVPTPSGRNGER